jgi:hypothetical protein
MSPQPRAAVCLLRSPPETRAEIDQHLSNFSRIFLRTGGTVDALDQLLAGLRVTASSKKQASREQRRRGLRIQSQAPLDRGLCLVQLAGHDLQYRQRAMILGEIPIESHRAVHGSARLRLITQQHRRPGESMPGAEVIRHVAD